MKNLLEIEMSLSKFYIYQNRCKRYWKKLTKEALKVGLEKNIEVHFVESDSAIPIGEKRILVYLVSGKIVDDSELLNLAKDRCPSLLRRYHTTLKKYEDERKTLKKLYEEPIASAL